MSGIEYDAGRSQNETEMVRCNGTLDLPTQEKSVMIEYPESWSHIMKSNDSFPLFLTIGGTEIFLVDQTCLAKIQPVSIESPTQFKLASDDLPHSLGYSRGRDTIATNGMRLY